MIRQSAFVVALLVFAPAAHGQSARVVMEEVLSQYDERMEGIDDYTVTQTVMGMESIMFFIRSETDGHVAFVPDWSHMQVGGVSAEQMAGQDMSGQYDSNYFMRDDFIARMRVEGTENIDGHKTHVLVIDDFDGLDLSDFSGGENGLRPTSIRMYMDADDYVPRRMDMSGTMVMGDQSTDVSTTVFLKDYREVDGMLHPFTMEINTEGLGAAMGAAASGAEGMTPEQQAEMERLMADMDATLEKLPESQRSMVRKMMEAQMQGGMSSMMDEAMSAMVVQTLSVVVNAGPPGDE